MGYKQTFEKMLVEDWRCENKFCYKSIPLVIIVKHLNLDHWYYCGIDFLMNIWILRVCGFFQI